MLSRHRGGELVSPGAYLRLDTGDVVAVEKPFGWLPAVGRYLRASRLLLVAVVPFVGLLYVLFLPLATPAGLARLLLRSWRRGRARSRVALAGFARQVKVDLTKLSLN